MSNTFKFLTAILVVGVLGLFVFKHNIENNQPAAVPISQIPSGQNVTQVLNNSGHQRYGIYVAANWNQVPEQFIFDDASVRGVMPRLFWNKIETAEGVYDWSIIDQVFTKAVAAHKKVSLNLAPGRGTPSYVYAKGVPKVELTTGNGTCTANPVPWHPAYIAAYSSFVQTLAAHIKTNPAWYEALDAISLTPFSDATSELRIPTDQGLTPNYVCGGTASALNTTAAWQAAGYRPSKMFQTWSTMAAAFGTAFPDKIFKIPVIPSNAFPGINEEGALGDSKVLSDQLTQSIVDDGIRRFGSRFEVQWTALNGTNGPNRFVEDAGTKGAIESYQLEQRTYGAPVCGTNPASCNQDEFKAVINRAFGFGAQVVEIFPADLQSFPTALSLAKTQFETKYAVSTIPTVTPPVPGKPITGRPDPVNPNPNPTPDTQVPTVSVTAPVNNQYISREGTLTISTNTTDNVAVASVKIYINNQVKCTVTAAPYGCQWSWALPSWWPSWWPVSFSIKAEAYDAAGNMATSNTVTIKTH